MLLWFCIIPDVCPMHSVHRVKATQVGHIFSFQPFQLWVVFLFWSWIIHLIQEHNPESWQVVRVILVVLCPVPAEPTIFPFAPDHVLFVLREASLEVDWGTTVLLLMLGALQQVDQVGGATIQWLFYLDRVFIIKRRDFLILSLDKIFVNLADLVSTGSWPTARRDCTATGPWWSRWRLRRFPDYCGRADNLS